MQQAILATGSNQGDRQAWLQFAIDRIATLPETHVIKTAPIYETDPVDVAPEYRHLTFLNSALLIETMLTPQALLDALHSIEADAGRIRTTKNAPRPLDIDIICYGDWQVGGIRLNTSNLTLPHPRAIERDFVLLPLSHLLERSYDELQSILR